MFTGLPGGDLVLPVRLPQGAGQWAHLAHFLAAPAVWHKIDLVRVRDRKAPGGWRYYAHLLVHRSGYQSAATRARRGEIPASRRAGVDANVSNLSVASFPDEHPEQLVTERIGYTAEQQRAADRPARQARVRQKALDRSRRNTNADHYGPSVRQHKRAQRRAARGLTVKQVLNPGGPRHARAGEVAARIVAAHGNTITVEDTNISTWARLWGKRIASFSPGMLVTALAAERVCPRHWPSAPTTAHTAVYAATVTSFPPFWRPA